MNINMSYVLILPNSLFEDNKLLKKHKNVIIYEHPVYFTKYKYHKLKLILHRASMKYYQDFIKKKYKSKVVYIEYNNSITRYKNKNIYMYDPVDHLVMRDIKNIFKKKLNILDSPLFINENIKDIPKDMKFKAFYIWNRKI
jgi:deoxyribodipyrimidine photolyase-related protein